jgi:hypothetical protein
VERRRRKIVVIENGKVGQELPSPEQVAATVAENILHVFLPHDAVRHLRHGEMWRDLENPKPPLPFRLFSFLPFNKLVNQFKSKKRFLLCRAIYTPALVGYVGESMLEVFMYKQLTALSYHLNHPPYV